MCTPVRPLTERRPSIQPILSHTVTAHSDTAQPIEWTLSPSMRARRKDQVVLT